MFRTAFLDWRQDSVFRLATDGSLDIKQEEEDDVTYRLYKT